jgi:hypothetical protein
MLMSLIRVFRLRLGAPSAAAASALKLRFRHPHYLPSGAGVIGVHFDPAEIKAGSQLHRITLLDARRGADAVRESSRCIHGSDLLAGSQTIAHAGAVFARPGRALVAATALNRPNSEIADHPTLRCLGDVYRHRRFTVSRSRHDSVTIGQHEARRGQE